MVESSKRVKPWREDVRQAALDLHHPTIVGAVAVRIRFGFPRPKSHFGTGRNASKVKASAPKYCLSRAVGDIDKLTRSTLDALVSAGLLGDDSQVCHLVAERVYATRTGALIQIEELH